MNVANELYKLVSDIEKLDKTIAGVNEILSKQEGEKKSIPIRDDLGVLGITNDIDERINKLGLYFAYNDTYKQRFEAISESYKQRINPPKPEPETSVTNLEVPPVASPITSNSGVSNPITVPTETIVPSQ